MNFVSLNVGLAMSAHQGTSFSPEKRGASEISSFRQTLENDYADLKRMVRSPEEQEILDSEFERYQGGLKRRWEAQLAAHSRCLSWMITGPANFPTRRNQKRQETEHKRRQELVEFRPRALDAIRKKLRPELAPIMSGDSDAIERLEEKIQAEESLQETCKVANKILRAKNQTKEDKILEMVALGLSEKAALAMFEPDCFGNLGVPGYEIRNRNANIRRLKQRLEKIKRAKSIEDKVIEGSEIKVEISHADNRVRIFFPGKPGRDEREEMKKNGFRWTPSLGCWQAYVNYYTVEFAKGKASHGQAV